jgi:hypothetical protein
MRAARRRRAADLARTVISSLLVAGVVCALGYGLQRVALRAPTRGELLTARAAGVLLRYRHVVSEIRIAGQPPLRAECLQGWLPSRKGRPAGRGARVVFSDGESLLLGDRRVVRLAAGTRRVHLAPVAAVELAGCPRPLTDRISARLVGGRRVTAVDATFDGRAALRMHVRTLRSRFDVFVDRRTLQPLGVRVEARGQIGWSRVHPVPLTPAGKRSFLERFGG